MQQPGTLVISLDFELYWGVFDKVALEDYRANLLGGREAVPRLLELFEQFGIHATWAVVGLLFFPNREDLLAGLPARRPGYLDTRYSAYARLQALGADEQQDPFHFAPSLIARIRRTPGQEIGSHTFAHYYCLERGQQLEEFRADLLAFERALRLGDPAARCLSLVFPRNQFNAEYLQVCRELGYRAYRGNPRSWLHRPRSDADESFFRRLCRAADAYVNLAGCHAPRLNGAEQPLNVPASRFLRPCPPRLKLLEPLRLRRIRRELDVAAQRGGVYHLWWHPHNFGRELAANLDFLRRVFEHYQKLHRQGRMASLNMREVAERERGAGR